MEKLRPVYSQSNLNRSLSHQEFQELLNSWCNEKGVLKELRLQLRFKLFHHLKYTIIGKDASHRNSQYSLFNQAMNLIVAEYLLQSKCYYSLSVFNTEANITNVLPDYLINSNEDAKGYELFNLHYNRENFSKIMDLIGLTKSSLYYDKLLSMYFDKQDVKSILTCLITLLCQLPNINYEQLTRNLHAIDVTKDEIKFIREMEELLSFANLPSSYVKKISQYITWYYEVKKERLEKDLRVSINKLKSEISTKDKIIEELNKSTDLLQKQLFKINKQYRKTKTHLENIVDKETIFTENEQNRRNIECNDKTNEMKVVKASVKEGNICELAHCSRVCAENKKITDDLLNENVILKRENGKQKETLQKLFVIYKDLLSKFRNCQSKINSGTVYGCTDNLFSNIFFEENIDVEGQLQEDVDVSDVNSDSLTEEILNQARITLQNLEDETKEVEDKFTYYRYT